MALKIRPSEPLSSGKQIERCRRSRDILCEGLAKTGRVRFFKPDAAFYLFFSIDGFSDSRALALKLIQRFPNVVDRADEESDALIDPEKSGTIRGL